MAKSQNTVTYRPIPGYPGNIAGSDGTIWSVRIRKLTPAPTGHYGRHLNCAVHTKEGKRRTIVVHQLVLMAFSGVRPKGKIACHKNDIGWDNRPENLYWGTYQDNYEDQKRNGKMKLKPGSHPHNYRCGEQHGNAKLTEANVRFILKAAASTRWGAKAELAVRFGVTKALISAIVKRRAWRHVVVTRRIRTPNENAKALEAAHRAGKFRRSMRSVSRKRSK